MAKLSGNGYMTAARIYAIALFQPDLAFCIPLIQLFVGLIAAGIHPGIYNKRAIWEINEYFFLPTSFNLAKNLHPANSAI